MSTVARIASRFAPVALAACLVAGRAHGQAPPAGGEVERAEAAYTNLEFADANRLAETALRKGNLPHDTLVRAYRVLALSHAALDRETAAREAFVALLAAEPDFELDARLAPKIRMPFFEAKGYWRAQSARPGLETSATARPRDGARITITLRDPTHAARKLRVGRRWSGAGNAEMVTELLPAESTVRTVPPEPGATRLDYFAQALDEHDSVVFEAGSAETPKSVPVEAERVAAAAGGSSAPASEGGSLFSSPWFWVAASAVVIGAGTATAFAVAGGQVEVRTLPPTTGALSPTLGCGPVPCN